MKYRKRPFSSLLPGKLTSSAGCEKNFRFSAHELGPAGEKISELVYADCRITKSVGAHEALFRVRKTNRADRARRDLD